MKALLSEIFVWWQGQTWGTRLYLKRFFKYVGSDEFGNRYYEDKKRGRRWVTYNGYADASSIPPGWHGWMHHRVDTPPVKEDYKPREWQKSYQPNLTGTPQAYRPQGSVLSPTTRPPVTGDYDAWIP